MTIPPNATSVSIEIVSEGGDTPGSITWAVASLSVEGGETPPTEVPCTPGADNAKWQAWLAWWKTYLTKKFGAAYAEKYMSYFDGGDCNSDDGDGCKPRRGHLRPLLAPQGLPAAVRRPAATRRRCWS